MLKWLVQRVPDPTLDVITDDPLATLDLDVSKRGGEGGGAIKKKKKGKNKNKEIYSVNRTNPLYHDHEDGPVHGVRRISEGDEEDEVGRGSYPSPPNTASSSSGYGSNENRAAGLTSPSSLESPHLDSRQRVTEIFRFTRTDITSDLELESAYHISEVGSKSKPRTFGVLSHRPPGIDGAKLTHTKVTPSSNHVPLVMLQKNSRFVQDIGMFGGQPTGNVLTVLKNDEYVRAIDFGDDRLLKQKRPPVTYKDNRCFGIRYHHQQRGMSPIGESGRESRQQDSIVTDSLLQMTSLSSENKNNKTDNDEDFFDEDLLKEDDDDVPDAITPANPLGLHKNEDMDKVIKELTQAVIKSRNVSTLTKAMSRNHRQASAMHGSTSSDGSRKSLRRSRLRNSVRALKAISKNHGVTAIRDLWEKTGMRTNGRKLLVDSMSEEDGNENRETPSQRRRRRKASNLPGKRFPRKTNSVGSLSSTGSSNAWSDVASPHGNTHFEVYTEIYKNGYRSQDSTASSKMSRLSQWSIDRRLKNINGLETIDLDEVDEITSHEEDGSHKKAVTFSRDVVDNENLRGRLLYEKIEITSPPRKTSGVWRSNLANDEVVVDIGKLNEGYGKAGHWESYYGASGKFSGDPGAGVAKNKELLGGEDYKTIFTSPYFDYRKTHSKAGSFSGKISGGDMSGFRRQMSVVTPKSSKKRRFCLYWQSILTIAMLGAVLVIVIVLTFHFTEDRERGS